MDLTTISLEVSEHIATITLDRPESLNAFNGAMAAEVAHAWRTIRDDDDVHVVVLQANGDKAFCTGLDVTDDPSWFMRDNVWNSFDPGVLLSPKLHHKVWKPLVVAVHGMAAGGGQYFLNEADIVICSDDATFFDPHASVGIVSALEPIGMLARGVNIGEVMRWALMGTKSGSPPRRRCASGSCPRWCRARSCATGPGRSPPPSPPATPARSRARCGRCGSRST